MGVAIIVFTEMTFSVRILLLLAILFLSMCHTTQDKEDIFHKIKSCRNGHGLKKGIVDEEGYECNLCDNSIGEGESIYSCDQCEYDVCYDCRRKKPMNTNTTEEVYLGMTGKLEYRGSCLKFQVIEIDPTKHFMHKVTYPNECFRYEWLFINLTSEKKYYATRTQNSHNIYQISNNPDNVFKTLYEARMDWFLDLDQCDKDKAVQLFSKLIQHYNGRFNQNVLTDMEEKLGIPPEQIQELYEFLFSKKNQVLEIGSEVVIHGLQKNNDFNGSSGKVIDKKEDGCLQIDLESIGDDKLQYYRYWAKPENLKLKTQPKNGCNIFKAESNAKKVIKGKRSKNHYKSDADEISNNPDNVFKTIYEARMDWFDNLDQSDKDKAVQQLSKWIQHYNGFNVNVLIDMEEKLGIPLKQIQQLYEVLSSKKNTQPKNGCNIFKAERSAKKVIKRKRTKTHYECDANEEARMDWFDNLDQRDKDKAIQLLSQGIHHYNGFNQNILTDMEAKFSILPAQTQQLYEFLYLKDNEQTKNDCDNFKDKKIAEKIIKSNDIGKDNFGKDNIESVSADVNNNLLNVPRDVEAKMTGILMYKGKEVNFEVRSISKPKENEKQRHFIFYLHKDAKRQADWVHLDLKKSAYISYEKNGHEVLDKILSIKFLDGEEFNSCPKDADKNEAEQLSNVNLEMTADCLEANPLDPFLKN